jgi:methionyl-tRNA formyltransferase
VTFAPRLKKETGKINWQDNVFNIVNLIHGLSPTPAAYTLLEGQVLKIFSAEANQSKVSEAPGTIGAVSATGLPVAASDGYVILKDVQLAGKKKMLISDFLRGHNIKPGTVLT